MRGTSLGVTAALTRVGMAALRATAPGGRERWERTNYAGRTVELYAGPATALAAAIGAGWIRPAAGVAVAVAGLCGAYDDVAGDHRRGFRAHMAALRDGEVTSGAVKLFGISAAGLVAGALMKERVVDKVLAGVVIAGAAHFVNLVDVRPGRAAGAVVALGAAGMGRCCERLSPPGTGGWDSLCTRSRLLLPLHGGSGESYVGCGPVGVLAQFPAPLRSGTFRSEKPSRHSCE